VQLTRRQALGVLGRAGLAAGFGCVLAGCGSPFAGARLRIATGGTAGEYYRLGRALAAVWQERLDLTAAPEVLSTNGSPANVSLLVTGAAEVAVSQLDVAADRTAGRSSLRALAAIYNDAVQIVVPAGSRIRAVTDLRGARVAIGPENSGVAYVALRVLAAAGLAGEADVRRVRLDLAGSVAALRAGDVDAFFWVGALPTTTVDELAAAEPVRLLDLDPLLDALRDRYPVYAPGTVLAGTYRIDDPVATLLVRNVLLVDAGLDADLVEALTGAVFVEQQRLADATQAARTVDARSAILTQPVPLHEGALRWFSDDATA
jgi:TRAP transporter TAXI family solute receptor